MILAEAVAEKIDLTWPDAFAVVGIAFAVALFFGLILTKRWPWQKGE